ncbi:MAG: hypothetical protein OEM76_04575 [Gammaproteobacteria bacterium]|nr:hypothetical protein [Gammaproteobacteria bacterium]
MHAEQIVQFEDRADEPSLVERLPVQETAYRPESPFLPEPEYDMESTVDATVVGYKQEAGGYQDTVETPFVTEYQLEGQALESAESVLHREIMEELYDEEFEDAIADLINEIRGRHEERYQGELSLNSEAVEQEMWQSLAPLDQQITGAIDQLIDGLVGIDNELLTEAQLESYLENFEYETDFEEPEFEAFFKKIWKKVKKVAKKGLKVLKKLSPIHIILGKLKKLVRPLLKRVLKFALNKVPARFRPLAKRLARRFFKGALGEIDESELDDEVMSLEGPVEQSDLEAADVESAAPSPAMIAAEFDALIAGYLIDGESFDREPAVVQYVNEEYFEGEQAEDQLAEARERFIQEISKAETEEEAVAAVEHFIPAILMGLKLGIKIIGRKRVVNFLAKLVAKLIRRFVGRRAAVPLARALVDAGLSMISLEAPEDAEYAAGEVIADSLVDTIDEFVTSTPEEAFEDDELMEVYVQDAFDHAVARNFPPRLLRRRLRQTSASRGMWMTFPRGRRKKRYKKFTEVFNVSISAPMAKSIRTFGGKNLYGFLKDQLGLPIDRSPVKAKLHLYQGLRGTSLSDISHLEKRVDGLGSRRRAAWMKIHPLTRHAAAVLIPSNVGLGRNVHGRFLEKRTRTAVGQRFYYLEVPGARIVRAPTASPEKVGSRKPQQPTPAKASEVNITLDFRAKEIRIYDFLSEAKSSEIAQGIRKGQSRVAIVRTISSTISAALRSILSKTPGKHLKIRREAPAEEEMIAGLAPVLRFVGRVVSQKVTQFVVKKLLEELKKTGKAFGASFVKAADDKSDGVTVIFTLSSIGEVFDVLSRNTLRRVKALAALRSTGVSGEMKIEIKPGFHKQ